jgi:hypothetical protein
VLQGDGVKDSDYINVTNLARLRVAEHCLHRVYVEKAEEKTYQKIMDLLEELRHKYELKVRS